MSWILMIIVVWFIGIVASGVFNAFTFERSVRASIR